jgi:hypothetical protein
MLKSGSGAMREAVLAGMPDALWTFFVSSRAQ